MNHLHHFHIFKLNLKEFVSSQSFKYFISDNLKTIFFRNMEGVVKSSFTNLY
jgi:hypothetical protein